MNDSWLFDQSPNCAAVTTTHVINHGKLITYVSHDADDHGWQFHCDVDFSMSDGRVVLLSEAVKLDDRLLELADLPPGWVATRASQSAPWVRSKAEIETANEPIECSICGIVHGEIPHIGSPAPYQWNDELEADSDSLLTEDLCIIEDRYFFVRGVIEITIENSDEDFGWGVWVSLEKENFETYRENYESSEIGPFFGWLSTDIDFFSDSTLNIGTSVKFIGENARPLIFINQCPHQMYKNQQNGITLEHAWETVHFYTQGE